MLKVRQLNLKVRAALTELYSVASKTSRGLRLSLYKINEKKKAVYLSKEI